MSSFVDFYNGLLKYDDNDIAIVVDEDLNIWFYAKQILDILKYKNSRDILKKFVAEFNKITYESIKYFSKYRFNIQDHSIFINEAGLYELALRSKKKKAVQFRKWITSTVIPTIRKTGKYELSMENKNKLTKVNDELEEYKKRVKVLENNQKREKYPDGGYIYIIQPPNQNDKKYKIGKTNNLNKRLNNYNTAIPDKVIVVDKIKVNSPIAVELCVKSLLYEYRYKNNKEYYQLDIEDIKKVIIECDQLVSNRHKCMSRTKPKKVKNSKDSVYGLLAITKDYEEYVKRSQIGGSYSIYDSYQNNKRMYRELKKI